MSTRGGREWEWRIGGRNSLARFDRVFRSMEDFMTAYKLLETRGVMIHILDAPGDPNAANGRAMLQLLCVFAEWCSRITSERNQAVVGILRQQGRPVSGTPPWGFQIVGPQGARRLEPDWEARAMMERIVRLHVPLRGVVSTLPDGPDQWCKFDCQHFRDWRLARPAAEVIAKLAGWQGCPSCPSSQLAWLVDLGLGRRCRYPFRPACDG